MTNLEFVKRVLEIAATEPTYRTGGSGKDGTCDCIGLIMGALGKDFPMHSTNYFARFQMRTKDILLDESQLHEGSVVYKSRRDTSQLSARYQPGGTHHAGDPLDYYHAGVVTKIDPLEITHCTSTNNINGIARDNSISAWSHFGDPLDVELAEEETMNAVIMEVYAENGKPVNVRMRPDVKSPKVGEVNVGGHVTVIERADEWAKISTGSGTGYMMGKFLYHVGATKPVEENTGETGGQLLTITLPVSAAQALYEALKNTL